MSSIAHELGAAPQTVDEIIAPWVKKISPGGMRMLDVVLKAKSISKADLAHLAHVNIEGGSFGTYLSRLRTIGLVEVDGVTVSLTTRRRCAALNKKHSIRQKERRARSAAAATCAPLPLRQSVRNGATARGRHLDRCFNRGVHAAHIIPRRYCGNLRDGIEAVVYSCEAHHKAWDNWTTRGKTVRAPIWMQKRLWEMLEKIAVEPLPNKYAPPA